MVYKALWSTKQLTFLKEVFVAEKMGPKIFVSRKAMNFAYMTFGKAHGKITLFLVNVIFNILCALKANLNHITIVKFHINKLMNQ